MTCSEFITQSEEFANLDLDATDIETKVEPYEKLATATINPECDNEQKTALRNTRTRLQQKITEIDRLVSDLETEIATLKDQINNLLNQINNVINDIIAAGQ